MSIAGMTDEEIIKKLEEKFGRDLTYIAPAGTDSRGRRVFNCLDIDAEAIVTVDSDGYVVSRLKNSKYGDVLGHI